MPNETPLSMRREDETGPTLPDLQLVRKLGEGAYGQVWLAQNKTTGAEVAVKIIPLQGADSATRIARELESLIRYEAKIRGQHPNLLTIHHVGQTPDFLFYTMDLADDAEGNRGATDPGFRPATLATRLESGPLHLDEAMTYAEQLLSGLAFIHEAGLAHRDIKPSNCVFVNGVLKLADFGLLTQTDSTASRVGTPQYMPPDGRMDARADVYAAGLVIYEMFSGLPAASFPRLSTALIKHRENSKMRTLNQLVLRACDPEPGRRFQNAAQMLDTLRVLQNKGPAKPRSIRRRIALITTPVLIVFVLLTVTNWPAGHLQRVDVNFITMPFEADIYLDGKKAVSPTGEPYRTPCTIPDLPARQHRVVFRKSGYPDIILKEADFAESRDVIASWKENRRAQQ